MGFRDALAELGRILEGDEMTGREAAIVIAVWMGAIAAFGILSYLVVFVGMGY